MPDWDYSLQKATLSPGTILFLYTDGLTEATRAGGELFAEERVLENLSGIEERTTSADIIAHMTTAVNEFVGDSEQSDDLTMMAIRMMPKS